MHRFVDELDAGLACTGYIMNIQYKQVAYAMWEESCAYTRHEYCGFLHLGPEDAEFVEAVCQNTVTKELHHIPVYCSSGLSTLREALERSELVSTAHKDQRRTICISRTSL